MEKLDGRLRPDERAMAVRVGESHKAYALSTGPECLLNETVGGEHTVVMGKAGGGGGRAVSGPMAGRKLTAVPSRTSLRFSLVGALPGIEFHTPD